MNDTELLQAILKAGYSAFPLGRDKKPLNTGGHKAATKDPKQLQRWQDLTGRKLWGVPAKPNGFFAVDIDPDGMQFWFDCMIDNGDVPETPCQKTPRGGRHYLFKYPEGIDVPNNAGKYAPGIDLRSNGYLATGGDGTGYEWINPINTPLADAPDWILKRIQELNEPKPAEVIQVREPIQAENPADYWFNKAVKEAKLGSRNETGFNLACQLRDSGISETEANLYLSLYANSVPQSKEDPYTYREAIASVKQAYSGVPREPAVLPKAKPIADVYSEKTASKAASAPPASSQPPAKVKESAKETVPPEPELPPIDDILQDIKPRYVIREMDYFLQQRPPIEQIIENLVTAGSVNVWVGKYGSKKTWSLISAAVCVAAAKEWLTHTVKGGTVLIIDEESGEERLSRRIGMALRGELINDYVPIKSVSLAQFNLLKRTQDQDAMIALIAEAGAKLVIIDALADIMAGGDENAVKDTQPVFMALRKIAEITSAAIIVIHHANRAGDYRGSSAIPGAIDTMIQIDSNDDSDIVTFKTVKMRDGEPMKFAAKAVWAGDQFYLTEAGPITDKSFLSKSQQYVLDYFTDRGDATLQNLVDDTGDLYATITLKSAIQRLINERLIIRKNSGGKGVEAIYGIIKDAWDSASK